MLERLDVIGDRLLAGHASLVDVGRVGEQVGEPGEPALRPDRQLDRRDPGAEPLTQLVQRALEAGPLAVELVDDHHPGHAKPSGLSPDRLGLRSEEHTSELQSLMRISYAVFCLKKKTSIPYSPTQKHKDKQN